MSLFVRLTLKNKSDYMDLCRQSSAQSKLCFFLVVMNGFESWIIEKAEP